MILHTILSSTLLLSASSTAVEPAPPGTEAGPGLALRAAKILTCVWEGPQAIDHGLVLIEGGEIRGVGREGELEVPEGYELVDLGERWLAPGMLDLHEHEAGYSLYSQINDLNDIVYLTNPGLRASVAAKPGVFSMKQAVAGGVTTVLYIPGSGTNISGQGVLLKTGFQHHEDNVVREPGSMKLAQWGNPERWAIGIGMCFEYWHTRETLRRGVAYAQRWQAFERGEGPEPLVDPQFEIFRDVAAKKTQISVHTQMYQVVLATINTLRGEFDFDIHMDHTTIGGWLTGALAQEMDAPAIVGPRSVDPTSRGMINWARNKHEGMRGVAAGYQAGGLEMVGFTTDAPVIPQEELTVHAAMSARYGMDDSEAQVVRGLTIVPARASSLDDRVGSIEVGKEADMLVITGHPADPRTSVEMVFIGGHRVYAAQRDGRRW